MVRRCLKQRWNNGDDGLAAMRAIHSLPALSLISSMHREAKATVPKWLLNRWDNGQDPNTKPMGNEIIDWLV